MTTKRIKKAKRLIRKLKESNVQVCENSVLLESVLFLLEKETRKPKRKDKRNISDFSHQMMGGK